jgi:hypothetical protein
VVVRPAKSTAMPSVIPVCPNASMLIRSLVNDNRQDQGLQFISDKYTSSSGYCTIAWFVTRAVGWKKPRDLQAW